MTRLASQLSRVQRGEPEKEFSGERRIVALVGVGVGPKIALRAKRVCVRIRGLAEGGKVILEIDGKLTEFLSDGEYEILGGKFAKAESRNTRSVICELIIGRGES